MKHILFLIPVLLFLLPGLLTLPITKAQTAPDVVNKLADTPADTSAKSNDAKLNVNALESNALKELSDSTKTSLDEKKKDVSDATIESNKALIEKEAVQKQVQSVEKELQETQEKMTQTGNQKSKFDVNKMQEKSRKLEKEYQILKNELKIKNEKAKKALENSTQKQDEIVQLKEQLHKLEMEKSKRYSPRKKALIMGAIVIITFIILFVKDKLVSFFEDRLIAQGKKRNAIGFLRARTFLRIFSWIMSVLVIAIAVFMILELFGFDSTTTLAGAGIFGVAIGFGAQQFIKDIFSGLFLVLEGQFGVNDFISVGQHSGNVEDINLRFTKLRNYDGNIIYVANGDIHSVVNYGKGYANSVIKFYIDVNQDVEQVFTLIRETVSELQSAPDLMDEMLSNVELLGINAFTPTGVEIKFRIKTAPQSQWLVGREVRLALKKRFDLEGIKLFQYQYEKQIAQQH